MDKQRIVPVKYWRECVSFWVFCDHCGHPVEVRGVEVRWKWEGTNGHALG